MQLTAAAFRLSRAFFALTLLLAAGSACVGTIDPTGATAGSPDGGGKEKGPTDGTGGSAMGTGGTMNAGSGGATATGGSSTSASGGQSAGGSGGSVPTGSGGSTCVPGAIPAAVQSLLASCSTCHGSTPLPKAPTLLSYADLTRPSTINPSQTGAERAMVRLRSTTDPMPPAGAPRPSDADVAALQAWIDAGYPMTICPVGPGSGGAGGSGGPGGSGGAGGSGSGGSDPFAGPSVCTSKTNWTGGNRGSSSMNPGKACIACHQMGEGPSFTLAGTVYPTAHEPDLCNGASGSSTGARIVITDAAGKVITLTPNAVGNFDYKGTVATPYKASVTYMGRERHMLTAQTSGDCNGCHTTSGAMSAPGRVLLP